MSYTVHKRLHDALSVSCLHLLNNTANGVMAKEQRSTQLRYPARAFSLKVEEGHCKYVSSFSSPPLSICSPLQHLYSTRPRVSNREHSQSTIRFCPVVLFVLRKGRSREDFDAEVTQALEDEGVQLVLCVGYMRILSPTFCQRWAGRCLNVHPSLLPDFAGGMDLQVNFFPLFAPHAPSTRLYTGAENDCA